MHTGKETVNDDSESEVEDEEVLGDISSVLANLNIDGEESAAADTVLKLAGWLKAMGYFCLSILFFLSSDIVGLGTSDRPTLVPFCCFVWQEM